MGKNGMPLTRARYITVSRPEHPLAWDDGRVRLHRAVLYDRIGPGPHKCHWCDTEVRWNSTPELVADHVDDNTWNNDPQNLVPSCRPCNGSRSLRQATHCAHGHEWNEENTYWRKNPGKPDTRMCRACSRERKSRKRVEPPTGRGRKAADPRRVALNPVGLTVGRLREWVANSDHIDAETSVYIAYPEEGNNG